MDFARNFVEVFEEHNPFLFEHKQRHADCTVGLVKAQNIHNLDKMAEQTLNLIFGDVSLYVCSLTF